MIEKTYLDSILSRFREYKSLGDKTFEQLPDEGFHYEPGESTNSISVIVQHMHGNMLSRWTNFLTEDGEKPWRHRDSEFEETGLSRTEILERWEAGWKVVFETLESLHPEDMMKNVTIRSQPLMVIDAINRQFAHYSYHVGQIVYLGKIIKGLAWKSLSIPKGESQQFNTKMSRH